MQRTHKTVRGMSRLNDLLKNGMGSVVVAQLLKQLSKSVLHTGVNLSQKRKNGPNDLRRIHNRPCKDLNTM
jgi:hypothetical protein